MIGEGFKFGLLTGAMCIWSLQMMLVGCELFDFTADPPRSGLVSNSSHFDAKMTEKTTASFHRCLVLCKTMRGCSTLNYERSSRTCVLYSTIVTHTFDPVPGDWVIAEIDSITFPTVPTTCDPSTCEIGQVCETISTGQLCMNIETS